MSAPLPMPFALLLDREQPPADLDAAVACFERRAGQRLDAARAALEFFSLAIQNTPGMLDFVAEWEVNRRLGAACPGDKVLFIPRESGCYATAMPGASDAQRAVLEEYDAQLTRMLARVVDIELVGAALVVAYALNLAGIESPFTRRYLELLDALPNDHERRRALAMPAEHEWESDEIAEMTRISVGEAMGSK